MLHRSHSSRICLFSLPQMPASSLPLSFRDTKSSRCHCQRVPLWPQSRWPGSVKGNLFCSNSFTFHFLFSLFFPFSRNTQMHDKKLFHAYVSSCIQFKPESFAFRWTSLTSLIIISISKSIGSLITLLWLHKDGGAHFKIGLSAVNSSVTPSGSVKFSQNCTSAVYSRIWNYIIKTDMTDEGIVSYTLTQ